MRNLVYFAIMGQLHKHFMRAFLVQNCFLQLFSDYSLAFVTFWPKDIGTKAACKMLMKLTTGSNFIIILGSTFAPVDLHRSY